MFLVENPTPTAPDIQTINLKTENERRELL
jgi:hypothetical protein